MGCEMTNAELIEKLKTYPMDALVVHRSDNFELNGATVEYDGYPFISYYVKESREFTDAFDYTNYSKTVFNTPTKNAGNIIKCLQI